MDAFSSPVSLRGDKDGDDDDDRARKESHPGCPLSSRGNARKIRPIARERERERADLPYCLTALPALEANYPVAGHRATFVALHLTVVVGFRKII